LIDHTIIASLSTYYCQSHDRKALIYA